MSQMQDVKSSLLGVEGNKDTNLKSAITAMVERLDDGVRRLEMASETGQPDMREELLSVAQVLSQQQQEALMTSHIEHL